MDRNAILKMRVFFDGKRFKCGEIDKKGRYFERNGLKLISKRVECTLKALNEPWRVMTSLR